ncbi:hypothetical protein [Endozoicomonas euniceicola]|uniref:Uncharacterized protein n=1 Tax=Endozoicomonas euniceicola TaxID=1234143 RepID=A0ABY6GUS5_9GAMM|nr:hypothetical protein [Endozoicomonas euniceicola]UYM16337.1 hypothetical protein NX720_26685 [Endozoicomonas euniceicola]
MRIPLLMGMSSVLISYGFSEAQENKPLSPEMKELVWQATSEPCGKVLKDQKVDFVIVTARLLQDREEMLRISKDQKRLDNYLNQQAEICKMFPERTFYDLGSYQ